MQELGEPRACRLGPLDPELPLGAVLVPAGQVLLVGGAHAVRERALRARVQVGRVREDRELAADGLADGACGGDRLGGAMRRVVLWRRASPVPVSRVGAHSDPKQYVATTSGIR